MKVLWLTSWYPNEINKTNGDFVQRQAIATALFCNVHVIDVEADKKNQLEKNIVRTQTVRGNLTETIVLYKASQFVEKLSSLLTYKKLFKKEIKQYILNNGLPDIVHVHVPMKAGIIALWLKRKYKLPYVITEHWTIYANDSTAPYKTRNFIFKLFTKRIFKNASCFLPVSNNLGELVCKQVLSIPYKVVYNVVDANFFNDIESIAGKIFTFVHVSTLNYQKNPELIIEAFIPFRKIHPESRLLMIGEIPEELQQYISYHKTENILFTGFMEYKEVALQLKQSNAFVLFSRYENMPCVVLEALCCGLPVITSNAGGLSEIININNGIVVDQYTKDALIKAMTKMYNDHHQYNKETISVKAIEMFSYETIGKQVRNIYDEVKSPK